MKIYQLNKNERTLVKIKIGYHNFISKGMSYSLRSIYTSPIDYSEILGFRIL